MCEKLFICFPYKNTALFQSSCHAAVPPETRVQRITVINKSHVSELKEVSGFCLEDVNVYFLFHVINTERKLITTFSSLLPPKYKHLFFTLC